MANGTTKDINTQGEWVLIETETADTKFTGFTEGRKYNIQCINEAYMKIDEVIFKITNRELTFTMGEDDPYIKTSLSGCTFSILEVPEEQ